MKTAAAFLFLGFLLVVEVKGQPWVLKSRCFCADEGINKVSRKAIEKVQIIPPGPSCERLEIVVTLMNGAGTKCLNPGSNFTKYILKPIQRKKRTGSRRMNQA